MKNRIGFFAALVLAFTLPAPAAAQSKPQSNLPGPVVLASGWQLQDVAKAPQTGAQIASQGYNPAGWHNATVPGTVLTSLVNDGVYPEPLYGENMRPIPESLVHTSYWYRITVTVPGSYRGRHVWLNFEGINYSSEVWVNGVQVGTTRGAFIRGIFDITSHVTPGQDAVVAVHVWPQPHPGVPHEHTLRDGVGRNGGMTAIDGPTFLATIGWDWLPAIRDRDTGIWQKVFLSATGPVTVKDPYVTTDLPLPKTDSADVTIKATVENVTDAPVKGTLTGTIDKIKFSRDLELAPHSSQVVSFDAQNTPVLHMESPRLWWPNGYGEPNLYTLHLSFTSNKEISDADDVTFGVRKISYSVPGADTLTISVNGVPVFIRGGDWGMDEGMKRVPRERLETLIRLHKLANLNLIRNWVGQSTEQDFYDMCDKYGIMVWDEFFQPNPSDGPDPTDIPTYVANVRDKILRFRDHPSIILWCARNEGYPPPEIDVQLRKLLASLDPVRRYQPSSTDGAGVRSHGPYNWRTPYDFYTVTDDYFKTETGSMSIPTIESIHGMMPQKDWETIDDDWAQHDMAKGAQSGDLYPGVLAARYGKLANLADFVRKGQLANYEAFRAMYEGRNALLFHPTTAIITWMSDPAQPSFVWQIYHYDFDPMSSFFAVMHAGEMRHIQYNQATGELQVINNLPYPLTDATAHVAIYNLDGKLATQSDKKFTAAPEAATNLGRVEFPAAPASTPPAVQFLKLELRDSSGKLISSNFYWVGAPQNPDDLTALNQLPMVTLDVKATQKNDHGVRRVIVTLHNPTPQIALMAHLELKRTASHGESAERVLPVFDSDNYVSLVPGETRTITMEAADDGFHGEKPLVTVDGWNVTVATATSHGVSIAPDLDAQPSHWPTTGLPFATTGLR